MRVSPHLWLPFLIKQPVQSLIGLGGVLQKLGTDSSSVQDHHGAVEAEIEVVAATNIQPGFFCNTLLTDLAENSWGHLHLS